MHMFTYAAIHSHATRQMNVALGVRVWYVLRTTILDGGARCQQGRSGSVSCVLLCVGMVLNKEPNTNTAHMLDIVGASCDPSVVHKFAVNTFFWLQLHSVKVTFYFVHVPCNLLFNLQNCEKRQTTHGRWKKRGFEPPI